MTRFATGTPRSEINLNAVVGTGSTSSLDDIFCFMGETEMGEPDKPTLVKSEQEFAQKFGAKDNGFRLTCLRALRSGVKLRVSRVCSRNSDGVVLGTKAFGTAQIGNYATEYITAKNVGISGNKIRVDVTAYSSTETKIKASFNGFTESYLIPKSPLVADIQIANASLTLIQIQELGSDGIWNGTFDFPLFAGLLAFATEPPAAAQADYTGSQSAQTGIYAFDNIQTIKWIAAPDVALNAIDSALVSYAEKRNAIALLRVPTGISGGLSVKYRNSATPYSGTAIDSFRGFMFGGGVTITHPTTGLKTNICEIADVAIAISKKNKYGKIYESFAINTYGKVSDALAVPYNLLISSRKSESDEFFDNGLNAIVQDENGNIKVWGDNTLAASYSALSFTGNVEYVQSLISSIKPIIDSYIHKINKIVTWRLMYREIKKVLDVYLVESSDNRPRPDTAIGEYVYQGDQNANKIDDSEMTVNTVDEVNSGIYKVILDVQLPSTMRFIRLDINASLQGVSISVTESI